MTIAAGQLDRLVTIERLTETGAQSGGYSETWAPWRTVWMSKREIGAVERFQSFQPIADETAIFVSRHIPGLLYTDRLNVDGQLYDITSIAEIGRREGLEIVAIARRSSS